MESTKVASLRSAFSFVGKSPTIQKGVCGRSVPALTEDDFWPE